MAASHGREGFVLQSVEDEIGSGTSALGQTPASRAQRAVLQPEKCEEHGKASFVVVTGERKVPTRQRFFQDHGIRQIGVLFHGPLAGGLSRALSMPMLAGGHSRCRDLCHPTCP